jgi:hypothetical protein
LKLPHKQTIMPPDPFENELNPENASVYPSVNSAPPVAFVEGFMGPGKPKNWGPLAEIFKDTGIDQNCSRKLIFVNPGCCNSLHDRAIEIFYQIKGGRGNKIWCSKILEWRIH